MSSSAYQRANWAAVARLRHSVCISLGVLLACGASTSINDVNPSAGGGSSSATADSGGSTAAAGAASSTNTGGIDAVGGNETTGGAAVNTGGAMSTGGATTGAASSTNTGGIGAAGGNEATGGAAVNTGGAQAHSGGAMSTGGATTEPLHCSDPDVLHVVSLSAGAMHTCALMSNGGVRCWGDNEDGQLGDGTTTSRSAAPTTDVLTGVQAVAAGGYGHTCALMDTGGVRCWGLNLNGELGDSSNDLCVWSYMVTTHSGFVTVSENLPCRLSPPTSDALTGAHAVALGSSHTCVLMDTGGVRCWGDNFFGQLGDNTTTDKATPLTTDVLTGVKAIAAGSSHTCVLMDTGGVRCWGYNDYGQLGDGSTTDRHTPPATDVLTGVKAIAAGYRHTCALMDTGGLRCWGYNSYGQLGDNTTRNRATPPATDVLTGVQAVAAGGYGHTCVLMDTGGVRCWGSNNYGQLGDGTTTDRYTPPVTDVLTGAKAIAAGDSHTCALMDTGGVSCWGAYLQRKDNGSVVSRRATPGPVAGTCE